MLIFGLHKAGSRVIDNKKKKVGSRVQIEPANDTYIFNIRVDTIN